MTLQKAKEESVAGNSPDLWVKIEIHTIAYSCSGSMYCPPSRRILDVLNNASQGLSGDEPDFLMLRGARFHFPGKSGEQGETAYINKENIIFVMEVDSEHKGIGNSQDHRMYPYVDKLIKSVRLHMPSCTLSGQIHYSRVRQVRDELSLKPRFVALTDVDILLPYEEKPMKAGFVAVNRRHILSAMEI